MTQTAISKLRMLQYVKVENARSSQLMSLTKGMSRDHEIREHIPHTWASSNDNRFQSNFSAWSNCEAILGKTPNWPI